MCHNYVPMVSTDGDSLMFYSCHDFLRGHMIARHFISF